MGKDNLRDGRVKNWFYLENDLLDREDLTIYEKTVYIVIARYVNGENKAFPSYETIAKKGSMAKVQAMRVVKSLIKKGLLKKEVRRNKVNGGSTSNLYTLLNPKPNNKGKNEWVSVRYPGGIPQIPGVVSHRYPNNTSIKNTNLNNVNRTGGKEVVENSKGEIKKIPAEDEEDINDIRRKIKESLKEKGKCILKKSRNSVTEKDLLESNIDLKGKYSKRNEIKEYSVPRGYKF
ncbi:hypothetical protein ES703_67560 [subsurface metagenome]